LGTGLAVGWALARTSSELASVTVAFFNSGSNMVGGGQGTRFSRHVCEVRFCLFSMHV
jgi:hypothetical protein